MSAKLESQSKARFTAHAHVLKAIAHPSRLFMVDRLSQGEECVCRLAEMLGVDMSTASKHLTILKQAGIVQDEKRGSMVFYRLRAPKVMHCIDWVESVVKATAQERLSLVR